MIDLRIISNASSGNFKPENLILLVIDYYIETMEQEDPELLNKCCYIKNGN